MTSHADIETALVTFVEDEFLFGMEDVSLEADDDLLASGYVDSLGVMRIVHFVQERYEVRVRPADITLENFLTVRAIGRYVMSLLSPTGVAAGDPPA